MILRIKYSKTKYCFIIIKSPSYKAVDYFHRFYGVILILGLKFLDNIGIKHGSGQFSALM